MPTLMDGMGETIGRAWAELPERLHVADRGGEVVFQCGPGLFGSDTDGWDQAIQTRLAG